MASRAKMRKIVAYGRKSGMGEPANREQMEDVLKEVRNGKVRAQFRARLTRSIPFLFLFFVMACAPRVSVVTRPAFKTPMPNPLLVVANEKLLLKISADGTRWEWTGSKEDVVTEFILYINKQAQQYSDLVTKMLAQAAAPKTETKPMGKVKGKK